VTIIDTSVAPTVGYTSQPWPEALVKSS
jgi:hypothetical protein